MLSWYFHLVGILCWAIYLGSVYIFHETLLMSQYQANPWIVHLKVIYHIFSYLKSHIKMGRIGYDPMGPNICFLVFNNNADGIEFYGDVGEELPPKIPDPRGRYVSIYSFVDSNHAGSFATRRLHTIIIMFIQNAPNIWFSIRI